MRALLFAALFAVATLVQGCSRESAQAAPVTLDKPTVVEAACGQCMLGLKGKKGCDLAVRHEGKSYFVDGVKMDDHGDAHADDGMCSVVRKAEVTGSVKGGRFAAASFVLLPAE